MKGFEVKINDNGRNVAVNKGVVIISLSTEFGLKITGFDDEEGVSLRWSEARFKQGDTVEIRPIDTNTTEASIEKVFRDRKELLESYLNLKQLLSEKRML